MDLGTNGFAVLHAIAGKGKAVFIDCAYMGAMPGEVRRFIPGDVVDQKVKLGLSAHQGDLLQTLALAREHGDCPNEVVIFGIEPATVSMGLELSDVLSGRMGEYVDAVCSELGVAHA